MANENENIGNQCGVKICNGLAYVVANVIENAWPS
jgi:hypothetical protein